VLLVGRGSGDHEVAPLVILEVFGVLGLDCTHLALRRRLREQRRYEKLKEGDALPEREVEVVVEREEKSKGR